MKVLVSDLIGVYLDWAVAQCEGVDVHYGEWQALWMRCDDVFGNERYPQGDDGKIYHPSRDWNLAGPIIEREEIRLEPPSVNRFWCAQHSIGYLLSGPNPLIAAMRCYVRKSYGSDEIELPDQITLTART